MKDDGLTDALPAAKAAPCPICRRPAGRAYRPFCSRRCADVDLARWFNGVYRIESNDAEAETEHET